ncbi:MAG: hypothetical protein ACM31G_10610 [Flavobacteriales bacterium]
MKNSSNQSQVLEAKIIALENKQKIKAEELKSQFDITYHELSPSKLITDLFKGTYNKIKNEPKIKGNILELVISLVGGYLSKKVLVGKSNSVLKGLFGFGVQLLTTKLISKKI